jgi:hypothetical protein
MKTKAIVHRHPNDPLYWEITECEDSQLEKTVADLKSFGSIIILTMNAKDIGEFEKYIAKFGGKSVGLI